MVPRMKQQALTLSHPKNEAAIPNLLTNYHEPVNNQRDKEAQFTCAKEAYRAGTTNAIQYLDKLFEIRHPQRKQRKVRRRGGHGANPEPTKIEQQALTLNQPKNEAAIPDYNYEYGPVNNESPSLTLIQLMINHWSQPDPASSSFFSPFFF